MDIHHAPPSESTAPSWETSRPYLTGAALLEPSTQEPTPLCTFPSSTQQALAVDDTLHALLGMRTSYTTVSAAPELSYVPCISALRHANADVEPLLARVLPLASHHAAVAQFVEETRVARQSSGFVRQAVGVALSELLADYRALVLRLEDSMLAGNLNMQKLLYYVQPSVRSMALLRRVVAACREKNGGAALDALYKLAVAHVGAEDVSEVLAFIVGKAAEPIFAIMDVWIRTGVIDDPYGEFFIQENAAFAAGAPRATLATSASAWEMRYTVNRENLPDFLAPFVENVLRSGKYLNVLRECGLDAAKAAKTSALPGERQELQTERDGRYAHLQLDGKVLLGAEASRRIASVVENSFAVSSRALIEYLDEEIRIMRRLRSLRKYFLLEQSDFLVNFFDSAAAELSKRRKDVSRGRLTSLLELSIRTSVSSLDEFQDDILCTLCPEDFASQIMGMSGSVDDARGHGLASMRATPGSISGYESFALDYRLKWPVSLIVSNMEILKYQFIFRYLFYCKYVERELEECWRQQSRAKGPLRKAPSSFVRSFALRNRMLQFVRNILYYTTADVLEPNWRILEANIRKSATIDDLMQYHTRFLDLSVEQSLLSNEKHLKVVKNIAETCISFAAYTEKFSRLFSTTLSSSGVEEKLRELHYPATLAKFETAFDMHLGKLLDGLSAVSKKRANVHLSNLCERLDVDGYYSRSTQRSLASYGM